MELVTLNTGQCLPVEAIGLAIELEFAGWELLQADGGGLRVVRKPALGDATLTDAQREAIKAHKPDLLRIVQTCEELACPDKPRTRRTRK